MMRRAAVLRKMPYDAVHVLARAITGAGNVEPAEIP